MPHLDLLEARVASGSLTTCSNPLLFIGNLFPRDTKVQGFFNTGSVGLGVTRSGLTLMTSLVNIVVGHWIMSLGSQARGCRVTATLFLVLSSLSHPAPRRELPEQCTISSVNTGSALAVGYDCPLC